MYCDINPKYIPVECQDELISESLKITYHKYLTEKNLNILSDIDADSLD